MNNAYFHDGRLDAIETTGPMTLADTTMPSMVVSYSPAPVSGQTIAAYEESATIAIDANGSGSKLLVTITKAMFNFGTPLSNVVHTITVGSAKVAWDVDPKTSATGTAAASTLKELIDLINEIPNVYANCLHAPWDMSVNSDNFMDLATTNIPNRGGAGVTRLECLYRDASDFQNSDGYEVAYMRIGMPEAWDRDAQRLFSINGTSTGITSGTLKLYTDNKEDVGTTKKLLLNKTLVEAQTEYLNGGSGFTIDNAPTFRGSLILEVAASDLTAASMWVSRQQAQLRTM